MMREVALKLLCASDVGDDLQARGASTALSGPAVEDIFAGLRRLARRILAIVPLVVVAAAIIVGASSRAPGPWMPAEHGGSRPSAGSA